MFPPDIFRHTLTRLVAILRHHGVRFHLTGGITSVAYGEPRMTQDIDIVVDNVPLSRAADAFIAAVSEAGFLLDPKQVRQAIAEKSMFQLFDMAEALIPRQTRVGQGFDAHRWGPGSSVWLCGVEIPHDQTLIGHSDADAGLHALTDAILGAMGDGDIGDHHWRHDHWHHRPRHRGRWHWRVHSG